MITAEQCLEPGYCPACEASYWRHLERWVRTGDPGALDAMLKAVTLYVPDRPRFRDLTTAGITYVTEAVRWPWPE